MWQHESGANGGVRIEQLAVPGMTPGMKPVTAIPLILPDDHEYDPGTMKVQKKAFASRKNLYVVPEAIRMISSIYEPVSVLGICGPARTGKSYILSRVLGQPDAFDLGHRMDPKTFGIWVGTQVVKGMDKKGKPFCMLLIDTEGIDAVSASKEQDASIFVLTILLCSQLVYNSLNVPYKKDLDKLECFSRLAFSIQVKEGEDVDVTDDEYFPNFLWLLRDVSLIIPDDTSGNPMDPTQYIKEKVLKCSTKMVKTREDQTAQMIRLLFPKIEAFTLPCPHASPEVMQNIAEHTKDLSEWFETGVQEIVKKLIDNCREKPKRGFDKASAVTGQILACMTEEYVKAVNDPNKIPQMKSTWESVMARLVQETMDTLCIKYREDMQDRIRAASHVNGKELPLEEHASDGSQNQSLLAMHKLVFEAVNKALVDKIGPFGQAASGDENRLKQIIDTFQGKLVRYKSITTTVDQKQFQCQEICGGELWQFLQKNRQLSEQYCEDVYLSLFQPIKDRIENETDTYTFEHMMTDMDQFYRAYNHTAKGPAKMAVKQRLDTQVAAAQTENLKKLKGYQKKVMKAKQEAKEREDEANKRAKELSRMKEETEMMRKQHEQNMRSMKETFEKQMGEMKEEERQRRENEQRRAEELQAANMKEFASAIKESSKSNNDAMNNLMAQMQSNQQQHMNQMMELMNNMQPPRVIEVPRPICSIM